MQCTNFVWLKEPALIDFQPTASHPEKAILIGIITPETTEAQVNEYLNELAFLAETAGAQAVRRFVQKLPHPDPRTMIGKGKLEEIKRYLNGKDIPSLSSTKN